MSDFEEITLPGPARALDEAIAYLAPQTPEDHECAVERVTELARLFYSLLETEKSSPRAGHVRAEIVRLAADIQRLRDTFDSLEDFTFLELAELESREHWDADFEAVGFERFFPDGDDFKSKWISKLNILGKVIELKLTKFDETYPRDVGGKSNLAHFSRGSAKWNLVYKGRIIFEHFRPGEATATDGGKFHEFVKRIFELTTNKRPEENSKLISLVKRVATIGRKFSAVIDEAFDLETELLYYMRAWDGDSVQHRARSEEISRRLKELEELRARYDEEIRKRL